MRSDEPYDGKPKSSSRNWSHGETGPASNTGVSATMNAETGGFWRSIKRRMQSYMTGSHREQVFKEAAEAVKRAQLGMLYSDEVESPTDDKALDPTGCVGKARRAGSTPRPHRKHLVTGQEDAKRTTRVGTDARRRAGHACPEQQSDWPLAAPDRQIQSRGWRRHRTADGAIRR